MMLYHICRALIELVAGRNSSEPFLVKENGAKVTIKENSLKPSKLLAQCRYKKKPTQTTGEDKKKIIS